MCKGHDMSMKNTLRKGSRNREQYKGFWLDERPGKHDFWNRLDGAVCLSRIELGYLFSVGSYLEELC
jgi:hypothetical protein